MSYICKCDNLSKICFYNFKKGQRCRRCNGGKRYTLEQVRKIFENNGCVLLEDKYVNNQTPMSYRCECGNESKIKLGHLMDGHRCMKCSSSEKYTTEFMKNFFSERGCVLLEDEYKSAWTKMNYRCSCGNESVTTFTTFKKSLCCPKCSYHKAAEESRFSFEFVRKTFEDGGCVLLADEYNNTKERLPYICECGNESVIDFSNFRNGVRCRSCNQSHGERNIKNILNEIGFNFVPEVRFDECKNKRLLRFDFLVETNNGNQFLVEFQGMQHYQPVRWSNSMTDEKMSHIHECTKNNDKIKANWAAKEKIPLLIIPYWQMGEIKTLIEDFIKVADLAQVTNLKCA